MSIEKPMSTEKPKLTKSKLEHLSDSIRKELPNWSKSVTDHSFVDHCRTGFRRFCIGTSCHGFAELYHAKTVIWTIIWVVIILIAFGLTVLQVYNAVSQYTGQAPSTVIQLASEDEILYPPLRLCHNHWMFWVDWKKITAMNYSKEVVLFSLTYLYHIVSSRWFDVNDAKNQFLKIMAKNNMSSILAFYQSISKPVTITYNDNDTRIGFDKIEIVHRDNVYLYCYTLSEQHIFNILSSSKSGLGKPKRISKELSFVVVDQTYENFKEYISLNEYNAYMKWFIESSTDYQIDTTQPDYSFYNFAPRITLYPDAYNKKVIKISSENDVYNVDFHASACIWMPKPPFPCSETFRSLSSNNTCKLKCAALIYKFICTCQNIDRAIAINEDEFNKVCSNPILFWTSENNVNVTVDNNRVVNHFNEVAVCLVDEESDLKYEECAKTCVEACQVWKYDFSLTVQMSSTTVRKFGKKSCTRVTVNYPSGTDIVIMREIEGQSWDNFVGNVGGLLGIWTGTSIVSIFQFVYLCCFAEHDNI